MKKIIFNLVETKSYDSKVWHVTLLIPCSLYPVNRTPAKLELHYESMLECRGICTSNTSLTMPGALTHCLWPCTACNTALPLKSKMATSGSIFINSIQGGGVLSWRFHSYQQEHIILCIYCVFDYILLWSCKPHDRCVLGMRMSRPWVNKMKLRLTSPPLLLQIC